MRGNSFVVGGARAFPASARGTVYRGLMHLLDWHAVFAGLAGVSSPPESGKSLDAIDLWADIVGTEVSGGPVVRREEALLNLDGQMGALVAELPGLGLWKVLRNV